MGRIARAAGLLVALTLGSAGAGAAELPLARNGAAARSALPTTPSAIKQGPGRELEPAQPPRPLDRELGDEPPAPKPTPPANPDALVEFRFPPPLGFTGPSGVLPRSGSNVEYDTIEDRWRQGVPEWDRYGLGHPTVFDYPYRPGHPLNPFNQHVLKGDFPVYGQDVFFNVSGTLATLGELRKIPTATTPFESTNRPLTTDFFGRNGQALASSTLTVSADLFRGDAAFKPADWRLHLTPAVNLNGLAVQELGVVSPDVRDGLNRTQTWTTLQEWFGEYKLADLSSQYDFVSIRAGAQPFVSDFRGFIFSDINRGVRLFGNLDGNRTQFNLAYFRQLEKDTNSQLNSFHDRNQNIVVANVYQQDFLFPGYTAEASIHYNDDGPQVLFDRNRFLVRPDPAGVFQPHRVQAVYLGLAGDGHIGRFNITHAAYWALGRDSQNPIAQTAQNINAQMAAVELSYDRDWIRFKASGLYQSGDGNPNNRHATGFDGIQDQMNFGGEFSFWRRQRIPLFGVGLTNDQSQYANLRSSRVQGQSNFVNPGLWLVGGGADVEITPRLRSINNVNALFFDKTASLETFVFQSQIDRYIGTDLSTGIEYRPRVNNNVIILGGVSGLVPGPGFRQLYNNKDAKTPGLLAGFVEVILAF